MKGSLYTIYDRIAEESAPPFYARTNGVAVRHYLAAVKNLNCTDFWLYRVATYGLDDMMVYGLEKPERIKVSDGVDEVEAHG
jgi:hypothetical protein